MVLPCGTPFPVSPAVGALHGHRQLMPTDSLRILRFLCLVSLPSGLRGCRFFLAEHGHGSGEDVRDTRHARIQPCGVKVLVQLD